jgi:hypothetical protein
MGRTTFAAAAAAVVLAAASPATSAGEPRSSATESIARSLLVRYFDAIRANDKRAACALYRIPECGTRTPFDLASYDLGELQRLHPPAQGDWAALVYLFPPAPEAKIPRPVTVAIAVVTCRPTCKITGFYGLDG